MNFEAYCDDILMRGLDDWIQLSEVVSVMKGFHPAAPKDKIRNLSIAVIESLLTASLMEVGDLTRDGFHPWKLAPVQSLSRIRDEWIDLGREPDLGEICWLSNTAAGNARAQRLDEARRRGN